MAPVSCLTCNTVWQRQLFREPIIGQARFGLAQNFENRPSIFSTEPLELVVHVTVGQNIVKTSIDPRTGFLRHGVENLAIDHEGERIPEHAGLNIRVEPVAA